MKVLITCPPMLKSIGEFKSLFEEKGIELVCPNVVQTLSESELVKLVPEVDGWIIGDDPATAIVFKAGREGRLKAAVKWGVGVDNVDFKAATALNIPISNTPAMFGEEVSDVALAYLLALARHTHEIDRNVRQGIWHKPPGISLSGRKVALIGFGNIGKATAYKLKAFGLKIEIFDPFATPTEEEKKLFVFDTLNTITHKADFLIVTCALTKENKHLVNSSIIELLNPCSYLINVSRGPLMDELAVLNALTSGHLKGAGLDVFENEPLSPDNPLLNFENVIFGSHNGSNTIDAVKRASYKAIDLLLTYLGKK